MTAELSPVLVLVVSGLLGLVLIPFGLRALGDPARHPGLRLAHQFPNPERVVSGTHDWAGNPGRGVRGVDRVRLREKIRRLEPSRGALVGGLIGAIFGVPVPIIGSVVGGFVGAFVGAAVFEYTRQRQSGVAAKAGWGAVLGRAAAAAVKIAVGLVMVVAALFAAGSA